VKAIAGALVVAAALATSTWAEPMTFYIGTYTHSGKSDGIYSCSLDPETGKLGPVKLAAKVHDPSYLAISPDARFLYAAVETRTGAIGAFAIKPDSTLRPLNQQPSGGAGACHVSVDGSGRVAFIANYTAGNIAAFPTNPDGSLADRSAFVQYTGTGPDPKRQEAPHAHGIYPDPANRFVYSPDLGTDNVWIFRLDPASGVLSPASPASAKVPPSSGPRHLAFHPRRNTVYVVNEMGLSVTTFIRDPESGALESVQTIPALEPGTPAAGATTAEIACHPSGKRVYVSTRGTHTITVFDVAQDGSLTRAQVAPAHVKTPRGFAIDPSGRWLVAAGQDDNRLAVFAIDPQTGKLSAEPVSTGEVSAPVCILFSPAAHR
jgi:6-phosphogluconolactonase